MELLQLEVFANLARYENMSVVAQLLNTSQPQVSRMLASLEAELGVHLFDRVGRNIVLNAQGKAFLKYTDIALDAVSDGRNHILRTKDETTGEVKIATFAFSSILNNVCLAFREENPLVSFRFSPGNIGTNDTNLLLTSPINGHYVSEAQFPISRKLFDEKYYLVFSGGHFPALMGRNSLALSEIIDYPMILMGATRNISSDTYLYDSLFQMTGRSPMVAFRSNEYAHKMLMVRAGVGLSLLPDSCLESAYQIVPDLQVVEFTDFSYTRSIIVARKPRVVLSNVESDFWDYLIGFYDLEPDNAV